MAVCLGEKQEKLSRRQANIGFLKGDAFRVVISMVSIDEISSPELAENPRMVGFLTQGLMGLGIMGY